MLQGREFVVVEKIVFELVLVDDFFSRLDHDAFGDVFHGPVDGGLG